MPIESAIVGIVLFEAFHDVQYLTTVWLYNERVAAKGQRLGAFSKLLFRPGVIGIGIYVGLCWLYGSFGLIGKSVLGEGAVTTLSALVLASLLLHFYYDSFLWSVRDQRVRDDFGLDGMRRVAPAASQGARWAGPGAGWLWLAVPLAVLVVTQLSSLRDPLEASRKLTYSMPSYAPGWTELGRRALMAGDAGLGISAFERAGELAPDSDDATRGLVEAYAREGRGVDSLGAFERLEARGGADGRTLFVAASLLHDSDPTTADEYYVRALALEPV